MAEYIVNGPSSPERLKAAGMEVIVRCTDCELSGEWNEHCACAIEIVRTPSLAFCGRTFMPVRPNDYCSRGKLKEMANGK